MKKVYSAALFTFIIFLSLTFNLNINAQIDLDIKGEAPGGEVTDNESMISALGGEKSAWINENGEVCLRRDIILRSPIIIKSGEILFKGASCIVERGFSGKSMFEIKGGVFVLGNTKNTDKGETLVLEGGSDNYTGRIFTIDGGTLSVYNGTVIKNANAANENGGAILILNGTLELFGGLISDCSAANGGGISAQGGYVNFKGGQIKSCRAESFGGGVYVEGSSAAFSGGFVGAVVTYDENMYDSHVEENASNTAQTGGGIALISSPECYLSENFSAASNQAQKGGGLYVSPDAELLVAGGSVSYNTAVLEGGGMYNTGMVAFAYCSLSYNEAKHGGGLYNSENAYFAAKEGSISSNKAELGAGIYNTENARFEMSGGSVNYNEASKYAGGAVNYSEFVLGGGSFGYNKSAGDYAKDLLNCGSLTFENEVFVGGEGDIALMSSKTLPETDSAIKLLGPFTCTTTIARIIPVIENSDGTLSANYKKNTVLLVTDDNTEELNLENYSKLFSVPKDKTGGAWHINSSGKLAANTFGLTFWLVLSAIVIIIAATVVFVVITPRKKNTVKKNSGN